MAKGFYGGIGTWENPGIRFKTFGKWDETIRLMQRLKPAIKNASLAAQVIVCEEICRKVKNHLLKQDLPWVPLTKAYATTKANKSLDDRMLIAWGSYYEAIKVWRIGNQHMVMVGIRKGIYGKTPTGKRSRLEIAQIAAFHEFSANPLRRRPLWNPTIQELGGQKGIKSLYLKNLYNQLRKRNIPVYYAPGSTSIHIEGKIYQL